MRRPPPETWRDLAIQLLLLGIAGAMAGALLPVLNMLQVQSNRGFTEFGGSTDDELTCYVGIGAGLGAALGFGFAFWRWRAAATKQRSRHRREPPPDRSADS